MTLTEWLSVITITMTLLSLYLFSKYNHYRSLVKQRGSFRKWPVKSITLPEVDSVFEINEFGPTINTSVEFIGRGHLLVPGGTSDTEAWILSVFSKKAKRIFEFGTCTGKTAYLMAKNSPVDAQVITLTLPPEQILAYEVSADDSKRATRDALSESKFARFLYTDTPAEKKITQIFGDSKHFDEKPYEKQIDLIFVDGSHALSYVYSDSEKAFRMVSPGGLILWHDYRGPFQTLDVYKALNKLSKTKPIYHIEGTSLVVFKNTH
jgi:predicted O-methyltransferase YrrM